MKKYSYHDGLRWMRELPEDCNAFFEKFAIENDGDGTVLSDLVEYRTQQLSKDPTRTLHASGQIDVYDKNKILIAQIDMKEGVVCRMKRVRLHPDGRFRCFKNVANEDVSFSKRRQV